MSFQQRWSEIASLRLKHAMVQENFNQADEEEGVLRPFKTMTRRLLFPAEFVSDEDFKAATCIFYPDSLFRGLWDVISLVFIAFQATLIPLSIAFPESPVEWVELDYAMQIFFCLDIFLNFNLAYYELGALVINRKAIAKRYALSWLVFDAIATFPNELVICGEFSCDSSNLSKTFNLLRFFKMFRLVRLAKLNSILFTIEDTASSRMLAAVILVFKLVLILFFIAHWLACFWLFIAYYVEQDYPETWISGMNLQDDGPSELYVSAMYWAFTTSLSVGYGDLKPYNIQETNVCALCMVLSSVAFAYLLGSVTAFVSQQAFQETAHRETFMTLSTLMNKKRVPGALKLKVKRYLNYLWELKKEQPIDESKLIRNLSGPLRTEIYSVTRGPLLLSCRVLLSMFGKQIQVLSNLLVSEIFAPDDIVFNEGELSRSIYFIKSGEVDIYQKQTRSTYKVLEEMQYFGELAFFSEQPRCASSKCRFFTELMKLERNLVDEAFQSMPEANVAMDFIEERIAEDDLAVLEIQCYICQEEGHVANVCPQIMIMCDKERIKRSWLESRKNTSRRVNTNDFTDLTDSTKKSFKSMRIGEYSIRNVMGTASQLPFKDLSLLKKARRYIKEHALYSSEQVNLSMPKPKLTFLFGQDSDPEVEDTSPKFKLFNPVRKNLRTPTVLFSKFVEARLRAIRGRTAEAEVSAL